MLYNSEIMVTTSGQESIPTQDGTATESYTQVPTRSVRRNGPSELPVRTVRPSAPLVKDRAPWLTLAALVVLGAISGIAYYLGFVRPYLLSDYYAKPLLDLAKISKATPQSANEWAFTWVVVFACYWAAFRICPPAEGVTRSFKRVAFVLICAGGAFSALNLLFMYPVGAADLFDQIFRARLTSHYALNPFTTVPGSITGDPLQAYVAWRGESSPYGPVWESLAAGTSLLAGGDLWGNLIAFKLLVIAAYAVSVPLSYGILRAVRPEWALRGMLLFAWNPLVLFEIAGNGHNDAVVIMFVLAGVFFFVRARQTLVIPAILLGALAKFVPVLLIPTAVAALWRDRAQRVGGRAPRKPIVNIGLGVGISVVLAAILYAPFWTGLEGLLPRNRGTLFTASIPKVILDTLTGTYKIQQSTAEGLVRNGAYAIVGLVAVALAVWVFLTPNATTQEGRAKMVDRTLKAFYEIIFVYLVVASLWFQPWYILWLIALTVPLAAQNTYVVRTLLFCLGGLLNYFVWDYLWLWNRTDGRTIQTMSALAIYTLPVLYTLWVWLQNLTNRSKSNQAIITERGHHKVQPATYELP